MCRRWQIGAAASDRLDATSPSTATTWSSFTSFCTAVTAASGLDWSSSTMIRIWLPKMPPVALI